MHHRSLYCTSSLPQVSRLDPILVGIRTVLTAHRPDKDVVRRSAAGVDGPRRIDHGFLVMHDNVSGLLRFSHKVEHHLVGRNAKIKIYFHSPFMRMRGHRVPYGTGFKRRHAHRQLARIQHVRMNVLVDRPGVALLE